MPRVVWKSAVRELSTKMVCRMYGRADCKSMSSSLSSPKTRRGVSKTENHLPCGTATTTEAVSDSWHSYRRSAAGSRVRRGGPGLEGVVRFQSRRSAGHASLFVYSQGMHSTARWVPDCWRCLDFEASRGALTANWNRYELDKNFGRTP